MVSATQQPHGHVPGNYRHIPRGLQKPEMGIILLIVSMNMSLGYGNGAKQC